MSISSDATEEGAAPGRFFLALAGSARLERDYPNGEALPLVNGCPSISVWPVDEVQCSTTRSGLGSTFTAPDHRKPVDLVTGTIGPGAARKTLTVYSVGPFESELGPEVYFQLPEAGTTYIPQDSRDSVPIALGDVEVFVPDTLDVIVYYRTLSLGESLQTSSPESLDPAELVWFEESRVAIRPRGSTIDTIGQRARERSLFLLGVGAGVLGGLTAPLFVMWRSAFRSPIASIKQRRPGLSGWRRP